MVNVSSGAPAFANGSGVPSDMSRIRPQCLVADRSDHSVAADVLLREEPNEEEEDDEEEKRKDEGNTDEGDDDEDSGYSV
jgi:hypothetical protein